MQAQSLTGLRIDGGDVPLLVYIDGQQVCTPSTSCFVANLREGTYLVEAYAVEYHYRTGRPECGERLFRSFVFHRGNGVQDLSVLPDRQSDYDRSHLPDLRRYRNSMRVMTPSGFDDFMKRLKREPFKDGKLALLDTVLPEAYFTCEQCSRMAELFSFDDDRLDVVMRVYPRVIDKEYGFRLMDLFTFQSSKDKLKALISNR